MANNYARPDVAFLPIADAPDFEWVFAWRRAGETRRIRAFNSCGLELVRASGRSNRAGFADVVPSS
jgi:hypothetical protein